MQPSKKWKKGLNVSQKIEKAMESLGLTPNQLIKLRSSIIKDNNN